MGRIEDAGIEDARTSMAITFDGTFEGFLCIVYAYYYDKILPESIQTDSYQQTLDTEEFYITTDNTKAMKVQLAIREKISHHAEDYLTYAFLSGAIEDDSQYMNMFHYILLGFKVGARVDDHLQQDYVLGVHKMARNVGREAHLLCGFSRFAKTDNDIYYCDISPRNNVLPILAEHFSDRMISQAWVIHDKKRNQAAIYNGQGYIICDVPKGVNVDFGDDEDKIRNLWGTFFKHLSIKERENKKLQRGMLPLYFRKHMTEFQLVSVTNQLDL